ncbi:PREDICTED: uncharacterized protein LOC109477091 isoform X1 [Branchiostoma belcheri]|uniref:Uncharacterized protein LOC109477091 isoform X1 n=1 Tax=Branchiostoma belcheri TaxID=7741 RepID=A0A6P4YWH2_BRABE|nr:PREDICTED: uncharacterized protein LOC109477091 isoform X1 [Branchiostoma belcheri]
MAKSGPGKQHQHTVEGEEGTVGALISYLRRMRTDVFGQVDPAQQQVQQQQQVQHCGYCGQRRCDCQTKRGDDSAIEEDKSDITDAPGDETTASAISQVNATMRQILQEIKDIKERSHGSQHGSQHGSDVVTQDKYQHVVDDLLAARSCHKELEDKLCLYENALKGKEEEDKKSREFQNTGGSESNTPEHEPKLENSLESESVYHSLGAQHTDLTQVRNMMSQLLQEILDMKKDKTEGNDTVAEERVERMNATVFDEVMEVLDPDVQVQVKVCEEETRRTSTPVETPAKDEDDKKLLEMQTSPIKKDLLESSCKVLEPSPSKEDGKVLRLTVDSQVQTVPIPRTREEVLRDLIQSDRQDGVSTAGQEGEETRPVQNKTDSRTNSQELQTECEKRCGLQPLDNNSVPVSVGVTTTCEEVEGENVNSKGGALGFFNFGKGTEKIEEKNVEGKMFSTSFFGFGPKAENDSSASSVNQRTSGFGLESKLSKFTSWVGDSIASTAMQFARKNSEKTTDSSGDQKQQQNVSVPGQYLNSQTLHPSSQSGDHPLASDDPTASPRRRVHPDTHTSPALVNEPPFTATYVTVQNVSPRGTLFHLLQNTEETDESISLTGNPKSETSQAKCQTEVQKWEKSGQPRMQEIPQTSFTDEGTLGTMEPVCETPPVQRKALKRSASLPRHAHLASAESRSVHRHVRNVGVVTSTSQQQTLPRKGILHHKQHVCEDTSYRPELWRRRGSNCVQVDTQEISSDAAASDDSKMSYSTKPQKHVTYSPYVHRKIISPRHSPKDRPKFFVPFLVEYDESSSCSDEDFETTYNKSYGQGSDYDDFASQKLRSSEVAARQKKLSPSPDSNPGSVQKRSCDLTDDLSLGHRPRLTHRSEQASSNFLQVPGMVPSVRPKVRLRTDAEDCLRHSREETSVQPSSRQPVSKQLSKKKSVSPTSSEDDPHVYRLQNPSQGEKKVRERESRHRLKGRVESLRTTDEDDLRSSHLMESAAVGKSREDNTTKTTQGRGRSRHRQQSTGRSVGNGTGSAASGLRDGEDSQGSSSTSSMGRNRRGQSVPRALQNKDNNSDSHSKPRYLHRSRSMDRGKWDRTADSDRISRSADMEERPWQAHGRRHSLGQTTDRTVGTGREELRHPPQPNTGTSRAESRHPGLPNTGTGRAESRRPGLTNTGTVRAESRHPPLPSTGTGRAESRHPGLPNTGTGRAESRHPGLTNTGTGRAESRHPGLTNTGTVRAESRHPGLPNTGTGRAESRHPGLPNTGTGRAESRHPPQPNTGTGRAESRHPGLTNTGKKRSRRVEHTADWGRFLFWNQVAAKSPQLKPRIIQSPQQIYGSAYQVEEETSSDSDDEVLQQYKRSMSQHSVRSKASVRSQRSKKGEKLPSPAEKPEAEAAYQPIEEPDYHHAPRATPADPYARLEKGEPEEAMVESDIEPDHASYLEYEEEGLDNEAYDSEGANGAYGDQVSYHSQEKRKRLKSRRHRPEGRSMSSQLNKEGLGGLSSGDESVTAYPVSDAVSVDEMSVASSTAPDPNWKKKTEDRGYYDVDQPYDEDSQLISKCGVLEVAFAYDAPNRKMTVSIVQARDVPSKDRGGTGGYQVHMVLLPTKKQRCKTKVRQGNNPVFKESFRFSRVNQDELPDMGVRFRLYACERMKKERLIGEKLVGFSNLKLDQRESMAVTLPLEPRSNLSGGDSQFSLSGLSRSDSGSSSQSLTHAGGVPELLVGLAYNATTGRLSVEVIKGSHFRNMAMNRAPDTYVKICLMASNGQELSRSKTSIRRGQPNPVYKETFIFQVALFQLSDVTLMFSVYNKRGMKRKEMIGWFSLGLNNSGEEELNHWQDMRESKGQQVCRWHVLLES